MNRLKDLRMEKGVSQQKIADYLGITRQSYSNYELGNREADYKTLTNLAKYFNTTVDYLLGISDSKSSTKEIEKETGNRIKQVRTSVGMSKKEFAKIFGITQNTLSQYENGKGELDAALLLEISEYFHVTVDYLLGKEQKNILADELNEDIKKADILFEKLSSENLDKVIDYMNLLLNSQDKE